MQSNPTDRRNFIGRTLLASGTALGLASFEERHLLARLDAAPCAPPGGAGAGDTVAGTTPQIPSARIGDLEIGRVICGGNLIIGSAHARDLIYVSPLIKAYHTDQKVFETLALAEEHGINTLLTTTRAGAVINAYWNDHAGRIQWISDCGGSKDIRDGIKASRDQGAHALYVHGGMCDQMVKRGEVARVGETLGLMKEMKVPAGIGAHSLETIKACVAAGFTPDFWVKTLHRDTYWSATPKATRQRFDEVSGNHPEHGRHHDNMWCTAPEETIAFMNSLKQPWIAFKTLAAGAFHPRDAFRWCFESGADFLCVGMFDFQIRENAMIARQAFETVRARGRARPWMA